MTEKRKKKKRKEKKKHNNNNNNNKKTNKDRNEQLGTEAILKVLELNDFLLHLT